MTREPVTTVPAHVVVASRETVPADRLQEYFDRAFTRSIEAIQSVGAVPAGPPRAYYFSPLTEVVDLAGGFPLAEEHVEAVAAAFPELVHRIPEFRVVVGRHHGPYDQLGAAWQEHTEYVRRLGHQTGPVFWEEYVTMPTPGADPADMITDLYVSLA